jgi:hypothetical protein
MSIEPPDRRPRQVMEHLGRDRTDGLHTHTHGFHPSMMMTAQRDDLLTGQLVVGFGWGAPSGDARLSDQKTIETIFPTNSPVS